MHASHASDNTLSQHRGEGVSLGVVGRPTALETHWGLEQTKLSHAKSEPLMHRFRSSEFSLVADRRTCVLINI